MTEKNLANEVNEEFAEDFKEYVKRGSEIRLELNEVEWRKMNDIKKMLMIILKVDKKTISAVNDAVHYKNGGYPNPSSPPRHVVAADKLASMFKYLEMVGQGNLINDYLHETYGVKMVVSDPEKNKLPVMTEIDENNYAKLTELVEKHCPQIMMEQTDVRKTLTELIDFMDEQQGVICGMSNEIKRDLYTDLKTKYTTVKKSEYLTNVVLRARELRKTNSGKKSKERKVKEIEKLETLLNIVFPPKEVNETKEENA